MYSLSIFIVLYIFVYFAYYVSTSLCILHID
nr:MAG TPA: hypothetical protein [Caudoviricetes sp.]DAP20715.1 MAG TPA: hypothetical protein [Caudoviricetes sp.]